MIDMKKMITPGQYSSCSANHNSARASLLITFLNSGLIDEDLSTYIDEFNRDFIVTDVSD